MTWPTAGGPGLPDYAPVPRASLGRAVNDREYYVLDLGSRMDVHP